MGPADARIMLVGEAPGRREDLQGEPFVGAAGRLLDALLASVGLTRGDVYITNTVKSRPSVGPPPGRNRAPAPGEILACRAWLDDQLRIIRPRVVVAMGRIALAYFLPGARISTVHGQIVRERGRTILPLFHPAAALRRRGVRQTLQRDVLKLRQVLRAAPGPRRKAREKEGSRRAQNTPS